MDKIKIDPKTAVLTDGTVTLRPYHKSDTLASYEAIKESVPELGVFLPFAHHNYSFEENKHWNKKTAGDWKKGIAYNFVIVDAKDGAIIGGCGINNIDKMNRRANLGYWVRTSRTKRGAATAATRLLARWAFENLKLNRIEIVVAVTNTPSLRVASKSGATKEGVLRNLLFLHEKPVDAVMHSLIPGDV